jgi:hypothetical protein
MFHSYSRLIDLCVTLYYSELKSHNEEKTMSPGAPAATGDVDDARLPPALF